MTIESESIAKKKPYEESFAWKKRYACITTSLAIFFVLGFFGSVFITNFETQVSIDISSSGDISDGTFRELIQEELSDKNLTTHLVAAEKNVAIVENNDIYSKKLKKVRDALTFRMMNHVKGNQCRLLAIYNGIGSDDEKHLANSISRSLARKIASTDNIADAAEAVKRQFELVKRHIASNASRLNQELESARRLIDDLNLGLSDIHESVESLGADERFRSGFKRQNIVGNEQLDAVQISELISAINGKLDQFSKTENDDELLNIAKALAMINSRMDELGLLESRETGNSIRIVNAAMPETNSVVSSILALLENCDTDSIQTQIGVAKNNLKTDSIQLREDVTSMKLLADQLTESRYVINSVSDAKTTPSNSQFGIGYLLVIGMISVVIGCVVSTYYKPELENLGFDSAEAVEQNLGVPIITSVAATEPDSNSENEHLANSLVRYSEVALFGFVLLTVLLCLVQPDLRQSFLENPIFGLSRMSGLFFW